MFSKTVLPVLGALVGSVVANPIERAIAEARANAVPIKVEFSPSSLLNVMGGGVGNQLASEEYTNLALLREDNLYWTHEGEGLLANMTVTAKPAYRLLNEHNFADLVQSVDCANPKQIKVKFNSASSVGDAKKAWSWVDESHTNRLVYIVDADGCGGKDGREAYHVSSVHYDEASATVSMAVRAAGEWEVFVEDASVRIGGSPDEDEAGALARRKSWSKKVKLNISKIFNENFYKADIGPAHLSVDCSDCGLHGSLDTDITVSTSDGITVSALTTDGVNVRLAIAVSVSAAITTSQLTQSIELAKWPLAEFKIGSLVELTPEFTVNIQIGITDIKGSVTSIVGAELDFADGQQISIGKGITNLNAQFKRIGPTISAKVDASARISPLVTFDLSGKILTKKVTAGLGLAAPYLALNVGADVNAPNTCGTTSVHYSVDTGAELSAFYGFGKPGDQPHKHTIYQKDYPLVKDCIAITH